MAKKPKKKKPLKPSKTKEFRELRKRRNLIEVDRQIRSDRDITYVEK